MLVEYPTLKFQKKRNFTAEVNVISALNLRSYTQTSTNLLYLQITIFLSRFRSAWNQLDEMQILYYLSNIATTLLYFSNYPIENSLLAYFWPMILRPSSIVFLDSAMNQVSVLLVKLENLIKSTPPNSASLKFGKNQIW